MAIQRNDGTWVEIGPHVINTNWIVYVSKNVQDRGVHYGPDGSLTTNGGECDKIYLAVQRGDQPACITLKDPADRAKFWKEFYGGARA